MCGKIILNLYILHSKNQHFNQLKIVKNITNKITYRLEKWQEYKMSLLKLHRNYLMMKFKKSVTFYHCVK